MLVGTRVGVGLTQSTISPMLRSLFPIKGMVVKPSVALTKLSPGRKGISTRIGYGSNNKLAHRFRCEDTSVNFMDVQPYYMCHQVDWSSHALFLSNWALGAMCNNDSDVYEIGYWLGNASGYHMFPTDLLIFSEGGSVERKVSMILMVNGKSPQCEGLSLVECSFTLTVTYKLS